MRKVAILLPAAVLIWGLAAASAGADIGQRARPSANANARYPTVLAKQLKCGGPELTCPGKLVKVCNPKNGKCCCATAGTYH